MIILDADEEQIAQSRAVLESGSESGRKFSGTGMLTLTNKRIAFESDRHGLVRVIALHAIQSVTPVKKDQLIISYPDQDGVKILKDRYQIKQVKGEAAAKLADYWVNLIKMMVVGEEYDARAAGADIDAKESPAHKAVVSNLSFPSSQNLNPSSEVVVDLSAGMLQWNRLPGWRKHQDEHLWQGGERMDEMTKQEWLAYKKEAFTLYNKIDDLYDEYFEAKKKAKNRQRCREIKEEMKIIDRELHGGEGVVPFKNMAADKWPES